MPIFDKIAFTKTLSFAEKASVPENNTRWHIRQAAFIVLRLPLYNWKLATNGMLNGYSVTIDILCKSSAVTIAAIGCFDVTPGGAETCML